MKSTPNTGMSTCTILNSPSGLRKKVMYSKIYKGSEEQIANWAIDFYRYLKNWKTRHPMYEYTIDIRDNAIHLTIVKFFNINGKTNSQV